MKKTMVGVLLLALVALGTFFAYQYLTKPESIEVGVILPLSGDLAFTAESHKAALETALVEVNDYLKGGGQDFRLKLRVADSQNQPEKALEALEGFRQDGIRVTIGPLTSEELVALKPLVEDREMLLLSPSSTAPSLAAPDRIFRFVPNDVEQAQAMTSFLEEKGADILIPVYRKDTYGSEFTEQLRKTEDILVANGFAYSGEQQEMTKLVKSLDEGIRLLLEQGVEPHKLAVAVIGFGEVTDIFREAAQYSSLKEIIWVGTDGIALNEELLQDQKASGFAQEVGFAASAFGMDKTSVYTKVLQQINKHYGKTADAEGILSYDILWLTAKLYEKVDRSAALSEMEKELLELTKLTPGASGWLMLDHDGDRKFAQYEFWQVQDFHWQAYAEYRRDPGLEGYVVFE